MRFDYTTRTKMGMKLKLYPNHQNNQYEDKCLENPTIPHKQTKNYRRKRTRIMRINLLFKSKWRSRDVGDSPIEEDVGVTCESGSSEAEKKSNQGKEKVEEAKPWHWD